MFGLIDQPQHPLEEYSPENSHELRRLSSSLESSLVAMECSIPSTMQNVTGLPDPRLLLHWMVMDDGKAADLRKREIQERASLVQKVLLKDRASKRHRLYSLPTQEPPLVIFDGNLEKRVVSGKNSCFRQRGGGCGTGNGRDEGNNGINVNLIIRKPAGWGRGNGQAAGQAQRQAQPRPGMGNTGQTLIIAIPVPLCPGDQIPALPAPGQNRASDADAEEQVVVVQDKYNPDTSREFAVKSVPNDPDGTFIVREIQAGSEGAAEAAGEEGEMFCDNAGGGQPDDGVTVYGNEGRIVSLRGGCMSEPIVIVNGGSVDTSPAQRPLRYAPSAPPQYDDQYGCPGTDYV